jgi:hypothetical protein
MRHIRPWLRHSVLALAALAIAGCAEQSDPAQRLLQPDAPRAESSAGWKKVAGNMPAFRVTGVIDANGGTLGVPGYWVTVPARAVSQPTEFVFESVGEGYLSVRLTATSVGSRQTNDVGEAGFAVPVLLSEQLDAAGGLPQWGRMVIAWERPDGVLDPVPSYFNPPTKVMTGRLSHFSQYTVATD